MKVSVEGVYRLSVRPFSPHASECHVYGWLTGSRQSRVIYELPGCGLLDSRYEYGAHPKTETRILVRLPYEHAEYHRRVRAVRLGDNT